VQFGCATTGSPPSLPCPRGSRRGCRTRVHGEACASFLAFSQPQTLELDNLNTWRVNEDDQGFRWSGQRPGRLALPEILARPLRAVWLNDPDRLSGMKVTIRPVRHFHCPGPATAAPGSLVCFSDHSAPAPRGVVTRFG
jgi:hypothetical protein